MDSPDYFENISDELASILGRAAFGKRLTNEECHRLAALHTPAQILALGKSGGINRLKRHGKKATWIFNLHINTSNICSGTCDFCAFRKTKDDDDAYVLTEDEILGTIDEMNPSEAHIVGGLNEIWDFDRNRNLLQLISKRFPDVSLKGFTAVEIDYFAKETNQSVKEVLSQLKEAGLKGMPGGGAEIFSPETRQKLCPSKISGDAWLHIHRQAHDLGLWTNATMLYGCGESCDEIADHLLKLRTLQDETGGFTAFIPLSWQNTKEKHLPNPILDLKIIALSRLILDNFPHIKAYWPMIGLGTAAAGLTFGADDLDGTLGKERIAHAAGASTPYALTSQTMEETILMSGMRPYERNSDFSLIRKPNTSGRPYRVGMFSFSNMAPFRELGPLKKSEFVDAVPSRSVSLLKRGEILAAAVPVGALPQLAETVEFAGNHGISATGEVESVLLFSNLPIDKLREDRKLIITSHSMTSVRLLFLLLGWTNGFDHIPGQTRNEDEADGKLLIGDQALVEKVKNGRNWQHIYDLSALWYDKTKLPFVFARWVVRADAPEEFKKILEDWLHGIDDREEELIERCAEKEREKTLLTKPEMVRYLKGMKRVIGPEEIRGQERFIDELYKREKWPVFGTEMVTTTDGVFLLDRMPLRQLLTLAHRKRMEIHPDNLVTFVADTNPNYTNVCSTKCSFCAFHCDKDSPSAFTLTAVQLANQVKTAVDCGATTVLLQGGHNPSIRLSHWIDYISEIQKTCPNVHIHPFSPSEIIEMAKREGISTGEVLDALFAAGIRTIPGGGAEILTARVREKISPKKCSADQWLNLMREAHKRGFKTTATMMFGHIETSQDVVEHLLKLRKLQDETGGFTSFIPWSFKPGSSPLSETCPHMVNPVRYVRIIATARLLLSNFENIQSSWFSENETSGALALLGGANDLGGILLEENVLATTGFVRTTTVDRVIKMVEQAGFTAARRDSHYEIIETFNQ